MTQAFQWPEFDPNEGGHVRDFPDWIVRAVEDGNLRMKDDLAHVRGPDGDTTVHPDDWIILAPDGCLFVASDELYRTLMPTPVQAATPPKPKPPEPQPKPTPIPPEEPEPDPEATDAHNAAVEGAETPDEPDELDPNFKPPFSSGVLARSARARALQARYDSKKQSTGPHPQHPRDLDDDRRDTHPG